jgi:hypothetical protein
MRKTVTTIPLLVVFIISISQILYKIQLRRPPNYQIKVLAFPKEKGSFYQFNAEYFYKIIKEKKKIQIELDGDKLINQNKIALIRHEARKLKYTKDTTSVIDITFTREVTFGEINELFNMCYDDKHKRFVLLKNRFIIFGEYPPPVKIKPNKVQPIYL